MIQEDEEGDPLSKRAPSPGLSLEYATTLEADYEMGKTVGRGEFAKVKVARCRTTRRLVAIKIVKIDEQQSRREERLYREITILSRLNHPNIIKLMRVIRLPDRLAIVMEYARGGELFDHVQSLGRLPEAQSRIIMGQIFRAVDYMHRHHIVHRDLKLENLLRDEHGQICITDFGFASYFENETSVLDTACGSPCYAAPELVLDKNGYAGPPVDIWSCGVILYAMSYGYLPFESDLPLDRQGSDPVNWTPTNVYNLYQHIASTPIRLPSSGDGLSPEGQDLLLRLLQADPRQRITMHEIWSHPWIQNSSIQGTQEYRMSV